MISVEPPKAPIGMPPPTILPRMVRSGAHPESLLRTSARDPKAGDHLVEHEQRAGGIAQLAQRLEEAGLGRDDAHVPGDRLDDHAGKPLAVARHGQCSRLDVVVRSDDRVRSRARRDARGRRNAERRGAGPGLGEQRVGMTVVAARELEDPVALRRAAGEPDRAHRRLGARADHSHLLDRRERVDDLGRELDLSFGRRAEGRALVGGLLDGLDRLPVGMAEDQRAEGHHPIDVLPAVGGRHVRALPAAHEERLVEPDGLHRAHGRVDAARDQALGLPRQLRLRLQSQARELLGPVADDEVGAGPLDRRQRLDRSLALVEPAARSGGLHHRVLAGDVVGGDGQVEATRERRGSRRDSGAPA